MLSHISQRDVYGTEVNTQQSLCMRHGSPDVRVHHEHDVGVNRLSASVAAHHMMKFSIFYTNPEKQTQWWNNYCSRTFLTFQKIWFQSAICPWSPWRSVLVLHNNPVKRVNNKINKRNPVVSAPCVFNLTVGIVLQGQITFSQIHL